MTQQVKEQYEANKILYQGLLPENYPHLPKLHCNEYVYKLTADTNILIEEDAMHNLELKIYRPMHTVQPTQSRARHFQEAQNHATDPE